MVEPRSAAWLGGCCLDARSVAVWSPREAPGRVRLSGGEQVRRVGSCPTFPRYLCERGRGRRSRVGDFESRTWRPRWKRLLPTASVPVPRWTHVGAAAAVFAARSIFLFFFFSFRHLCSISGALRNKTVVVAVVFFLFVGIGRLSGVRNPAACN